MSGLFQLKSCALFYSVHCTVGLVQVATGIHYAKVNIMPKWEAINIVGWEWNALLESFLLQGGQLYLKLYRLVCIIEEMLLKIQKSTESI